MFCWVFLGAILLSWNPVSHRQNSRWCFSKPRFLSSPPASFISLSQVPWRRDLAHSRKFLPLLISVLCVLLQVLKDRSPLLSWLRLAFTPASKQPALSNKMSPHKMNMSRRLGVYQTSYREAQSGAGVTKNRLTANALPHASPAAINWLYQNQQAFKADFQTVNFSFRELNGSQLKTPARVTWSAKWLLQNSDADAVGRTVVGTVGGGVAVVETEREKSSG